MGTTMVYPGRLHDAGAPARQCLHLGATHPGSPGVCIKPLARFNETGPYIRMLRIEPSGVLPGGEAAVHQIAAVVSGKAHYGEREIERGTISTTRLAAPTRRWGRRTRPASY